MYNVYSISIQNIHIIMKFKKGYIIYIEWVDYTK